MFTYLGTLQISRTVTKYLKHKLFVILAFFIDNISSNLPPNTRSFTPCLTERWNWLGPIRTNWLPFFHVQLLDAFCNVMLITTTETSFIIIFFPSTLHLWYRKQTYCADRNFTSDSTEVIAN